MLPEERGSFGTGMSAPVSVDPDSGTVHVHSLSYRFDQVFDEESTAADVHECVGGLVDGLLEGYNGTAFTWGVAGGGKTSMMYGDGQGEGIVHQAVLQLFDRIRGVLQTDPASTFLLHASILEVCNQQVYDLLPCGDDDEPLTLRCDENSVYLDGITLVEACVVEHLTDILAMSRERHEQRNERDPLRRAHTIVSIIVESNVRRSQQDPDNHRVGRLSLVDLSGDQASPNLQTENAPVQEPQTDLSALPAVVHALTTGQKQVPFGASPLTRLLQDSLGGNSRTVCLVCMSPASRHLVYTASALRFAQRLSKVTNFVEQNSNTDGKLPEYEGELRKLQAQLSRMMVTPELSSRAERDELEQRIAGLQSRVIMNLEPVPVKQVLMEGFPAAPQPTVEDQLDQLPVKANGQPAEEGGKPVFSDSMLEMSTVSAEGCGSDMGNPAGSPPASDLSRMLDATRALLEEKTRELTQTQLRLQALMSSKDNEAKDTGVRRSASAERLRAEWLDSQVRADQAEAERKAAQDKVLTLASVLRRVVGGVRIPSSQPLDVASKKVLDELGIKYSHLAPEQSTSWTPEPSLSPTPSYSGLRGWPTSSPGAQILHSAAMPPEDYPGAVHERPAEGRDARVNHYSDYHQGRWQATRPAGTSAPVVASGDDVPRSYVAASLQLRSPSPQTRRTSPQHSRGFLDVQRTPRMETRTHVMAPSPRLVPSGPIDASPTPWVSGVHNLRSSSAPRVGISSGPHRQVLLQPGPVLVDPRSPQRSLSPAPYRSPSPMPSRAVQMVASPSSPRRQAGWSVPMPPQPAAVAQQWSQPRPVALAARPS